MCASGAHCGLPVVDSIHWHTYSWQEMGTMPKYGRMWLTLTRGCLSELWSQDRLAYMSWWTNMQTHTGWRGLSLTLIIAVTELKSISIKEGSQLHHEECDLRCLHYSFFPQSLSPSVFYPPATSWLSPKASWLNVYLLGKLWPVCVCVSFVCVCVCVCLGDNECVSSCGLRKG